MAAIGLRCATFESSLPNLEELVRSKVQEFIQSLLEEEIAELLGRRKSERHRTMDSLPVYRNGFGKPRRWALEHLGILKSTITAGVSSLLTDAYYNPLSTDIPHTLNRRLNLVNCV